MITLRAMPAADLIARVSRTLTAGHNNCSTDLPGYCSRLRNRASMITATTVAAGSICRTGRCTLPGWAGACSPAAQHQHPGRARLETPPPPPTRPDPSLLAGQGRVQQRLANAFRHLHRRTIPRDGIRLYFCTPPWVRLHKTAGLRSQLRHPHRGLLHRRAQLGPPGLRLR